MSATRRAPSSIGSQRIFIPWKFVGFLLLGLAALGLTVRYLPLRPFFGASQGMPALVSVFGKARPVELRLAGGFHAGPYIPKAIDQGLVSRDRLETARRLILEEAGKGDDMNSKLGYARLALCEKTGAKARETLNELVKRFPHSAEVQNDMGVFHFEEAGMAVEASSFGPPKIVEAISNFDKAIEINPAMPEPLFNRAVCYQKLHLFDAATRDLHRLKEIEKDAGWLREADARIGEIESLLQPPHQEKEAVVSLEEALNAGDIEGANNIFARSLEGIWAYSVVKLPQAYLEARLHNDSELTAALAKRMDMLSLMMGERKRDSFPKEFYEYLRNVPDSEVEAEFKLAKDYWDATLTANTPTTSSLENLIRISEDCERRGNVHLRVLTDFSRTISLSVRNEYQASIDLLEGLISTADRHDWPLQRSNIILQLALAYADRGKLSLAIKLCSDEIEILKERPRLQAKANQLLGMTYWKLGNFDRALDFLHKSTGIYLTAGYDPTTVKDIQTEIGYNHLNIADIYYGYKNHTFAYQNVDQSLTFFNRVKALPYIAEALALKATEEANLGMDDEAEKTMSRALEVLSTVDAKPREYSEKLVLIRAGEVALHRADFNRALGHFATAADKATKDKGDETLKIRALRGLSEAAYKMGDAQKARDSLDRAIPSLEQYRAGGIRESGNRISYLNAVQSIFDQRVLLELQSFHDDAAAFNFAEASRARSLLDDIHARERKDSFSNSAMSGAQLTKPLPSRPTVKPLDLRGIQKVIPPNYVVLMYTITAEDAFASVLDRKSLNWKKLRATSDEIERDVKEYIAELRNVGDLGDINTKAAKLYRDLVEPVREWIPNDSVLCIVPDKSLNRMPMSTLIDSDGRYLVESFTITNAASASALIESLKMAARIPVPKDERLLMVANAKYPREAFPELKDISDSEAEAIATKARYSPTSITLLKGEATEQRIQSSIKECDVVHFALHVLVDEESPWHAALVLAPPESKQAADERGAGEGGRPASGGVYAARSKEVFEDPEDGLLYLSEVYNFGLTRTRLVVLSGCQSGLGQYYRGEGMVSLVMPFLASNVPTVMASLWSVNSPATSDLMIGFHKERKGDHPRAGDALRATQIKMLRGSEPFSHPYYWAPFIVVGGNN